MIPPATPNRRTAAHRPARAARARCAACEGAP